MTESPSLAPPRGLREHPDLAALAVAAHSGCSPPAGPACSRHVQATLPCASKLFRDPPLLPHQPVPQRCTCLGPPGQCPTSQHQDLHIGHTKHHAERLVQTSVLGKTQRPSPGSRIQPELPQAPRGLSSSLPAPDGPRHSQPDGRPCSPCLLLLAIFAVSCKDTGAWT